MSQSAALLAEGNLSMSSTRPLLLSRPVRATVGESLPDLIATGALILFAGVVPLLPMTNLKVDATVLAALCLAVAAYIRIRSGGRLGRSSLDLPALTLLGAAILATVFSVDPSLSFFPSNSRGEGLLIYVAYIPLALAAARLPRRYINAVLMAIVISGSLIGVIAVGQYYGVDAHAWVGLRTLTVNEFYRLTSTPGGSFSFATRSYGTLGNPVFLGGYAALLLPVIVTLAVQGKARWWWGYAGAATLVYAALVGSQTRAAWIASAGAAVLLVGWLPRSSQVWRRLALLAGVFAAVTIIMALTNPRASLGERAASLSPRAPSLQERLYIWKHTLPLLRERPLLGWGFSTFMGRFPDMGSEEYVRLWGHSVVLIDTPHNEVLHIAYSTGLVGLAAYLWVWGATGMSVLRLLRRPTGALPRLDAALLAGLAAYFVWLQLAWSLIGPANVFWTLAGSAAAIRHEG